MARQACPTSWGERGTEALCPAWLPQCLPREKSRGPGLLNEHRFSLLPTGGTLTTCHRHPQLWWQIGRPFYQPVVFTGGRTLPYRNSMHTPSHHLALPLLTSPKGLTVYTLYIARCACAHHLSPGSGAVKWGELCHFETYLLVRVLLFCPNCANCPSLAYSL